MTKFLTTKQVALALGVSDASLKRWCDKGWLTTIRTTGGHRRLPMGAVLDFIRERGYPLVRPEILSLPARVGFGHLTPDRSADQIRVALEQGDEELFRQSCYNLYLGGITILNICDQVLAPVFRQLGDRWYDGEVQIYQERRACQICLRWLHEMRHILPEAPADAPVAMGGTLSRDPYQIATTMVELVLQELGWRVESLGGNLPGSALARAIHDRRPSLAWISASYIEYEPDFISGFREVYEQAAHENALLITGGRALNRELREKLQYHAHCDQLQHLKDFMETTLKERN